jgi:hypothetical protein
MLERYGPEVVAELERSRADLSKISNEELWLLLAEYRV